MAPTLSVYASNGADLDGNKLPVFAEIPAKYTSRYGDENGRHQQFQDYFSQLIEWEKRHRKNEIAWLHFFAPCAAFFAPDIVVRTAPTCGGGGGGGGGGGDAVGGFMDRAGGMVAAHATQAIQGRLDNVTAGGTPAPGGGDAAAQPEPEPEPEPQGS